MIPGGIIMTGQNSSVASSAEAAAYFSAMTVKPNSSRKELLSNLISGLKSDNVWGQLSQLYIGAAHDAQAALINAITPSFIGINNGATHTIDRGYAGGYVKYGQIPFRPLGSFGFYISAVTTNTGNIFGRDDSNGPNFSMWDTGGGVAFSICDGDYDAMTNNKTTGHYAVTSDGSTKIAYLNGSLVASKATNANNTTDEAYNTFDSNRWNGGSQGTGDQIAYTYVSKGNLSSANIAAIHTRFKTYLTAVGVS